MLSQTLRRLFCLLFCLGLALAAGCGGGSTTGDGDTDADVTSEADGIIEDVTGDDTAGDPAEEPAEDVTGDTTEDVTEDTVEDVAEDVTEDTVEDAPLDGEDVIEDVIEDAVDAVDGEEVGECEPPKEFLCPCEGDDECDSGICWSTESYGDICTTECDGDCPEGWACVAVEIDEETVSICLPYAEVYCLACEEGVECGNEADQCSDLGGADYCLQDCTASETCPEGYTCTAIEGEEFDLCVPDGGECPGCVDGDEDGYGIGPDCDGPDCRDDNGDVHPGATEVCDGIDNDCNDEIDESCPDGECKEDYDGEGIGCAGETQCVHDGELFDDGDFSPDCASEDERMLCDDGEWFTVACEEDTVCTDNFCDDGECEAEHHAADTLCDDVFRCSEGAGDNNYDTDGLFSCQGYCDGEGSCDFAGSCEDCSGSDGWFEYGDDGPGCADMDDPTAEYRAHDCGGDGCGFEVTDTRDCDTQDGYVGGGNTAGCGNDPSSVLNDFFANASGECESTTAGCAVVDCDESDVCDTVCDETSIREYVDYYVTLNSDSCAAALGPLVADCATLASEDSDGGPLEVTTPGAVTDYTGCDDGDCTSTVYADYCVDALVYEYGADGSGVTGPYEFDCRDYGIDYCNDSRYLYLDIWGCHGEPGYCFNDADVPVDCGVDACEGTCGSGENGCMWHEKGCTDAACFDTAHDADDAEAYCDAGCSETWLANGTGANSSCCGDDAGEDFEQVEAAARACCYNAAELASLGTAASILCYNGQLYDCNDAAADDSGVAEVVTTGSTVDGLECKSDNSWGPPVTEDCDNFNIPNTTTIPGWTERSGNWTIESNMLRSQVTPSHQYITYNAEPARSDVCMTARAIYGTGASVRYIGFTGRFQNTSSLVQAKLQDNTTGGNFNSMWLYDNLDGGSAYSTSVAATTDANIQFELSGGTGTFRVDGNRDGTWDTTVTLGSIPTTPGLIGATGYNGAYLDDWCYADSCGSP
ncbi:MAG: hypothetical protein ABIJ56_23125 [Pseudomonadota bacterium]